LGYRCYFPGSKCTGREFNHSPPASAEVKNECPYAPTPHIRLHGVDTENLPSSFLLLFLLWCFDPSLDYGHCFAEGRRQLNFYESRCQPHEHLPCTVSVFPFVRYITQNVSGKSESLPASSWAADYLALDFAIPEINCLTL
jgi:hypothetical protein